MAFTLISDMLGAITAVCEVLWRLRYLVFVVVVDVVNVVKFLG